MGALTVKIPNRKGKKAATIELFEAASSGYLPQMDDVMDHKMINVEEVERAPFYERIKAMYRAIGRIMAHCLLQPVDSDIGPLPPMAHQSLPGLYRNGKTPLGLFLFASHSSQFSLPALFRNIYPVDEEYGLDSLADDVCDLLDLSEGQIDTALVRFGIEKRAPEKMASRFRTEVQRFKKVKVIKTLIFVHGIKQCL